MDDRLGLTPRRGEAALGAGGALVMLSPNRDKERDAVACRWIKIPEPN